MQQLQASWVWNPTAWLQTPGPDHCPVLASLQLPLQEGCSTGGRAVSGSREWRLHPSLMPLSMGPSLGGPSTPPPTPVLISLSAVRPASPGSPKPTPPRAMGQATAHPQRTGLPAFRRPNPSGPAPSQLLSLLVMPPQSPQITPQMQFLGIVARSMTLNPPRGGSGPRPRFEML